MADFRKYALADAAPLGVATLPAVLKVEEVADALRVSKQVVYRMIDRGDLHSIRTGHQIRIPLTSLSKLYVADSGETLSAHPPQEEKAQTAHAG